MATTTYLRPWQELKLSRIVLGLAVAPIVPLILSVPLILLARKGMNPPTLVVGIGVAVICLLVVELWSIGSGLAWLYTIARARGRLGRQGCLVLGSVCSFLFLVIVLFSGAMMFERDPRDFMIHTFGLMVLVLAVPALLGGLLGGWIFWRVSVRPISQTAALAPVFD